MRRRAQTSSSALKHGCSTSLLLRKPPATAERAIELRELRELLPLELGEG